MNRASNAIEGHVARGQGCAGAAIGGAVLAPTGGRALQVPDAIFSLLDSIDNAEELLGSIDSRLCSVTRSEAPTDAKSLNETPRPIRCELADQITNAVARVASLNSRMRSLLDRLEL